MNCKKCGCEFTPIKGLISFCSLQCRNSRTWSETDKLKKSESAKISEKVKVANSVGRKGALWNDPEKRIIQGLKVKKYYENNPEARDKAKLKMLGRVTSVETKKKLSDLRKQYLSDNPEKHPNRLCAGIKQSYPEQMVKELFDLHGLISNIDYIQQYKIDKYFVDFYIPILNLGIEVDGERWHQNIERELFRESIITKTISLIRFKALDITRKNVESDLLSIIARVVER